MDKPDNVFPMDVTDPSSRPWKFQATGFLVAILADTAESQRAEGALIEGGFLPQDIKLYTGKQTVENNVAYMERRDVTAKVVGAIIDDSDGLGLYLDYAREDRCAVWLRLPDEGVVPKALRVLADFDYLHARYYGDDKHTDFHIS